MDTQKLQDLKKEFSEFYKKFLEFEKTANEQEDCKIKFMRLHIERVLDRFLRFK